MGRALHALVPTGPWTRILFIVWAPGVRLHRPLIVVFENVARFPLAFLKSLFEDLYEMSHTYLEAADFGSPSRRLRLYAVLTLRGYMSLDGIASLSASFGHPVHALLPEDIWF